MIPLYKNSTPVAGTARLRADFPKGAHVIYLDNAATTLKKPDGVARAVADAIGSFGGPGRGSHAAAFAASMAVFEARSAVAGLLGAQDASRVSFTMNATMALNIALAGLLPDGGRAVTTAASHNSVLRPLFRARDLRGVQVEVARILPDGSLDWESYERALEGGANLVAATHASNVTGDVYDVARMASMAHDVGALFVLDAAQTAGAMPVDMAALGVDVLCFTGHKSLFGPQGTGGLIVREGLEIAPLLEGGSGVRSFDERQPSFMPEALEAGTENAHGLAGLAAGVEYVAQKAPATIAAQVAGLVERFERGLASIPGIVVYGGHASFGRSGIVAFNIDDADSGEVSARLDADFGICTRPGAHCAPLMHKALGTAEQGVVRASFSSFNTQAEVDAALEAVASIAHRAS